ncbi:MAG: hypothetical protein WCP57_08800 [Bacteroidota bacterium]
MELKKEFTWRKRKGCWFIFIPIMLFAISGIVMLLWNAILPDILPVSKINYWQAMGIFVLSKILFGGFRMGSRFNKHRPFNNRMGSEKFMQMNEEERANFKAAWKNRCQKD